MADKDTAANTAADEKLADDQAAAEKDRKASGAPSASEDAGEAQVAKKVAAAEAQGYLGAETDPTPNENYTFAGADKPTPETDKKLAAKARSASGT